jgi:hypothetical protein
MDYNHLIVDSAGLVTRPPPPPDPKAGLVVVYMGHQPLLVGKRAAILDVDLARAGKPVLLCIKEPPRDADGKRLVATHSGDGMGPEGHCWWARPEELCTPETWEAFTAAAQEAVAAKKVTLDIAAKFLAEDK